MATARVRVLCRAKGHRWHLAQALLLHHWHRAIAKAEMELLMEGSEEFSEVAGQGQKGLVSL